MLCKKLIDYVKIYCKSGSGGYGAIHFSRCRSRLGGPDGGNGGNGGNIIIRGNRDYLTLLHLKAKKYYHGGNGGSGGINRSTGANGKNYIIEVPIGTVVKTAYGKIIFEIISDNQEKPLFKGGKGGKGNWYFKNSFCKSPTYAQPGIKGHGGWIILEFKTNADIGLVGFPNSGKSTLLSVLTDAKPKIGDYAFTTLSPNFGVIHYNNYQSFIIADIPGIIKGASNGNGLGHYFLRHIERNTVLLFIIASDVKDPKKDYEILLDEISKYNTRLLKKPRLLVLSKYDLLNKKILYQIKKSLSCYPHLFVSSISKQGLADLKNNILTMIKSS